MEVSVVIPCKNAAATIGGQLSALSRQKWSGRWEVIVADNGSTDETSAVAKSFRCALPQLRLVDASKRRGAAHARNRGVAAAKGRAIVFCDADDEVGTGWLAAMASALEQHDFVAARLDIQKLNPPEIGNRLKNPQENGLQRVEYPPYLAHASGTSLGVKREIHEKVGGFDETLPRLMDTDYCFRIQLGGIPLVFARDALVHYRFGQNARDLFRQARLWAQYNVLMYKRYRQHDRLSQPWKRHLSRWSSLVRCAPRVLNRETRPAWLKALGTQIGLLQGAIKYGVPPIIALLISENNLARMLDYFAQMLLVD